MVLFGYGERHRRGKPERPEVVAICHYLVALGATELEDEIDGKALGVALDLLIQPLDGHPVERGEVGIDHDLVAADHEDLPGDARGDDERRSFSLLRDDVLPLPVFPELPDHHSEYLDVALGTNDGISFVLRPQYDTASFTREPLQRELVVQDRDDDVTSVGSASLLHYHHVARVDAGVDHRVALHLDEDGLRRMGNQMLVDGDRVGDGVGNRGW